MAVRFEAVANDPTYLVWAGDGAKNDTNAIFFIKKNGDSYFGGSLSAGPLVAEGRSTAVSFNPVETGIFGTNGAAKTVTWGVSYNNSGYLDTGGLAGPTSATLLLERSLNGGGWVHIATANASGNLTQEYDGEFRRYSTNVTCGGGGTFVDYTGGQPTFNYRIRIIDSVRWPYMLSGPSGAQWSNGNQSTRVRSVEG